MIASSLGNRLGHSQCILQRHSNRAQLQRPLRASETDSASIGVASDASRRRILQGAVIVPSALLLIQQQGADAAGFSKDLKKRKLVEADYQQSDDIGLRVHELEVGNSGSVVKAGDKVVVHFDVMFRGIDVVSSRSARLLGGNRTIAEPFEFIAGLPVSAQPVKKISDSAGGLFAGTSGPKPPPALSTAVLGMRRGGKRSVLVDKPDLGYGEKGLGELPPNQTFELRIEVLDVLPKK